jgi:hypothetical protein
MLGDHRSIELHPNLLGTLWFLKAQLGAADSARELTSVTTTLTRTQAIVTPKTKENLTK